MARDIDSTWAELSDIQQAGLDAALAAKSKSRKSKPAKAASGPAAPQADATAHGPHFEANGVAEVSSGLPNQDTASEADAAHGPSEGSSVDANGHLASEENQAANRQMPSGTSSISKSQVGQLLPVYLLWRCCHAACMQICKQHSAMATNRNTHSTHSGTHGGRTCKYHYVGDGDRTVRITVWLILTCTISQYVDVTVIFSLLCRSQTSPHRK